MRVVIAGYGPVGRAVAQMFPKGTKLTIIDLNPGTIDRQAELGAQVVLGDVSDAAVLKAAKIDAADALIIAIPDEEVAIAACAAARKLAPDVYIAARANFLSKGMACRQAGADYVVVEEVVTAEAMKNAVVNRLLANGNRQASHDI